MLGLPALVAALGGLILTSQAADAGQDTTEVTCTLVVPADPLSAKGLATPYRLRAPCHEADAGATAFVQATIVDPATGTISVYNPLVVDDGKPAAVVPTAPNLPAGAVVGVWFGFNGDNLQLADDGGSLAAGNCVNGAQNSIFGQFAYCNAPALFSAANAAIAAGKLTVADLGTAADGRPCPTTRDFGLVDMDQSDNVTTTYLALPDGTTAQNTAANRTALAKRGARIEVNGSDNGLLDAHVFPALGCTPYQAPDLADAGAPATALALNELQAAAHQQAPVALVPTSDPMTKIGERTSVAKTNLYRAGVGQPPIDQATETPTDYCRNLLQVGADRIQFDRALTVRAASPDPAAANSLFTFLAQRFSGAYDDLGCAGLLRIKNPVTVRTDANGVVVSATFAQQPNPGPSGSTTGRPSGSGPASPTGRPSASVPASPTGRASASASAPTAVPTSAPPAPAASATVPPTTSAATPAGPAATSVAPPAATMQQPVHTFQPPPMHTQPAPPAPQTTTTAQPAQTGDVSGGNAAIGTSGTTGATDPSGLAAVTAQPGGNPPGLAIDAMRLKAPTGKSTLTGHSISATTAGTVLLVVGGAAFVGAIIRTARRHRRS